MGRPSVAAGLALFAVVAALLAPSTAVAQPRPDSGFVDTAEDGYYWLPVETFAYDGVLDGTLCGDGSRFCPDEPLDRKTLAVWAVRVLDRNDPEAVSSTSFDDVDPNSFYAPFIERLAQRGITIGCGDGSRFCPDANMTRAEMAVMLARIYRLPNEPHVVRDPRFSDVPHDAWYRHEVASLFEAGMTVGCGDGNRFCPDRLASRAEGATMLYRRAGPYRPPHYPPVLTWHSSGDSYSSGTGAEPYYDDEFGCQRSYKAYGFVAVDALQQDGWAIGGPEGAEDITPSFKPVSFSACSGHHIEQFFSDHALGSDWHGQLWPRSSGRVDVLTMSFGGNDVGFDTLRAEFLECQLKSAALYLGVVPEACKDFVAGDLVLSFGNRIAWLLYPAKEDCTGLRYQLGQPDRYQCDLQLPDGRGTLDDFYYIAARDTLTADGRLYVAGYPQLIADYEDWPSDRCSILNPDLVRGVALVLAELTEKLNSTIKSAIDMANTRLGETKIIYLDVHRVYREGAHELCGAGDRWMHGFTLLGGRAFHPKAEGHQATGEALAELIKQTHPYATDLAEQEAAVAAYRIAYDAFLQYRRDLRSTPRRLVQMTPGSSAKGQPGCSTDPCRHLVMDLQGFAAGTYSVECWSSRNPDRPWNLDDNGDAPNWAWPTSSLWSQGGCWFGYPGERVWVIVDGVKSNEVIWPP
ncbi:MAG: S-layer homology domain-containing protein [Acidimicrobiaceae bacterium]|nr:S-layer homology domain-containing protein [Acidimicrobiaceae bacterium]MCY3648107.1 S-layer homology domain-containing protein [Acidimicrobiaceae bacterium]MDE0515937.1 S-layer homology domain-containing protein [Acidimicrobiaceae bacterium]MDE0654987.1 S-layer homology domain-containing protein [Acidimicrobiaceae bacterium]